MSEYAQVELSFCLWLPLPPVTVPSKLGLYTFLPLIKACTFGIEPNLSAFHSNLKAKYAKPDKDRKQVIYVTKVLIGHSTTGKGGMKVPPERLPGIPYDSLVNCPVNPTIYVSGHNDNQIYAEYLIEFENEDKKVVKKPQHGHIEIQNMDDIQYSLYYYLFYTHNHF